MIRNSVILGLKNRSCGLSLSRSVQFNRIYLYNFIIDHNKDLHTAIIVMLKGLVAQHFVESLAGGSELLLTTKELLIIQA
ncbi:unnamed protein product [Ilex paraguariensis]|uniref:Uncharacterized protein n=1 Tax=Ilex paraguariensis TaxID=185542 RepID=A0ABC8TZA9_9AQUA